MRRFNWLLATAAAGLLWAAGCTPGQDEGQANRGQDESAGGLDKLTKSVKELSGRIDQLQTTLEGVATQEDLEKTKDELDKRIEALAEVPRSLLEDVEELKRKDLDLQAQFARKDEELGTLLAGITKKGDLREIVDLNAIMADSDGRQDMEQAIRQSLPRTGRVVIENWMNRDYTVFVNQRRYFLPGRGANGAGILRIDSVPVGTVTTEFGTLANNPRTWTLGPPDYQLILKMPF